MKSDKLQDFSIQSFVGVPGPNFVRSKGMNTREYAARIGYEGPLDNSLETLEGVVRAQLLTVPFENFDIHLGKPIRLDTESLFRKIVRRGRGGFCYEVNGLLAEFLRALGFEVAYLAARVVRHEDLGPAFDHLALRVMVDGMPYLVDAGFGRASFAPLPLQPRASRTEYGLTVRVHQKAQDLLVEAQRGDSVHAYLLSPIPRQLSEFLDTCYFHQTSPRSWFTNTLICVRLTNYGQLSLVDGRLRENGDVVATLDEGEYLEVLRKRFRIDLPRLPEIKAHSGLMRLQRGMISLEERATKVWERGRGLLVS